jgi:hypothetical protein
VTWTVEESTVNLSTEVWKNSAGSTSRDGLMWVATDATPVNGATNWSGNTIQGTPSTTATAFLADVVGSRTIKVKASPDGELPAEGSFTFGDGPLSEFVKTTSSDTFLVWSLAYSSDNTNSPATSGNFQFSDNSFPAAEFCSGSGTVDRAVRTDTSPQAGFEPWDSASAYWSLEQETLKPFSEYHSSYVRRAVKSKLPTAEQLLAVSVYDSYYNGDVYRKGAARAAGWILDFTWSGEVLFDSYEGYFVAVGVNLGYGIVTWGDVLNNPGPVVCVR